MKLKILFLKLFFIILACTQLTYTTVVVFDVGGVIVKKNTKRAMAHIGYGNIAKLVALYMYKYPAQFFSNAFKGKDPLKMEESTFKLFSSIDVEVLNTSYQDEGAMYRGFPLVPIIGIHQKYNVSSYTILKLVKEHIEAQSLTNIEKVIYTRIAEIMFDPEVNASIMDIDKDTVELIKECKKQGHTLVLLSNYNAEAFAALDKRFTDVFALFDHRFVSGQVELVKPARGIYHKMLADINRDPQQELIVYTDDQPENLKVPSQELGIKCIQFTSAAEAQTKLIEFGAIVA